MSNRSLLSYLPSYYYGIAEFVQLMNTTEQERDLLMQSVSRLMDDQFVLTSSESAIRRREEQLQIQPDPSVETLDFRRKRIVNRYMTKPPFTERYLRNKLDTLLGQGKVTVSVDVQQFILKITASVEEASVFKEVNYTVQTMKPANLVYQQETSLNGEIRLEEHLYKRVLTRMTRLSSAWKLGRTPFSKSGEEVQLV